MFSLCSNKSFFRSELRRSQWWWWLAKSALDQDVLGSIPASSRQFSREPVILKFAGCQPTWISEWGDKK